MSIPYSRRDITHFYTFWQVQWWPLWGSDKTNLEDIDANSLEEICVAIYELYRQNQSLEDNVLNIRQCQQETNPLEEVDVL